MFLAAGAPVWELAERRLCAAVEQWARERGATRVSVTSGIHRSRAHAFNESIDYQRSGVRFMKPLG